METTFTKQELETIELAIGVLTELKRDEKQFLTDLSSALNLPLAEQRQSDFDIDVNDHHYKAIMGKVQRLRNSFETEPMAQ